MVCKKLGRVLVSGRIMRIFLLVDYLVMKLGMKISLLQVFATGI